MEDNQMTEIIKDDLLEIVYLCHAALAQDSPESKSYYLLQVLNMSFGYLTSEQRQSVETYLSEKQYLPPAPPIQIAKI